MVKKDVFKYKLTLFVYILVYFLTLIFCVWTTKQIKIIFYICFFFLIITSIYEYVYIHFYFTIKILYIINNVIRFKLTSLLFIISKGIFMTSIFFSLILIKNYNYYNYEIFLKNCPFTFTKESPYEKRRCELYNINKNSRYKYQYICSYDASKEFIDDEENENNFNEIICFIKENTIRTNTVINKFISVYNNKDNKLFYCNRIDQPKKNDYIKEEYCNKEINIPNIFSWLHILTYIMSLIHLHYFKKIYKAMIKKAYHLLEELNNNINNNFDNNSDCSTDDDESNSNDNSFIEDKDKNIIIENKRVYNIKSNIKEFFDNKKN